MKRCPNCVRDLFVECFDKSRSSPDGLQSWCKPCKSKHARMAHWQRDQAGRDAINARRQLRRPAYREHEAAYEKAYNERNRERNRAKDAERRKKPQRIAWQRAYWEQWKEKNRERAREISLKGQHVRHARKLSAFHENVEPAVVYARDRGLCGICGLPVDPKNFHVDHVIPFARGGEHSYANTQPAHPFCNVSKGMRLPEEIAA